MAETFGSYVLHRELGAGGIATVHLAESPAIQGQVAIKRMFPRVANVPELVAAFVDEARLARYLRHQNIARVYEFGRLKGTYYIVFEYVPGPTVQQLMQHCITHVGPLPVPIALEIMCQVCDALDHAHNMTDEHRQPLSIVHRDVSPSNLIVSSTGLVKLIDFGLAKTKQSTVQSQAGIIKGKLSYVAPEYLRGRLDARCDLWAVGVVLHELLTGRRLFEASDDNNETLQRVQKMPIPPPSQFNPEVSPEVDQVVMTALERDPAKRWQTAADLRVALGRHASARTVTKQQLVAWTEWAFSQKQPLQRDSATSALYEIIESKQVVAVGDLRAISEAIEDRRRESIAAIPVGAALLERRGSGRWIWIMLAMAAIAAAVGALLAYVRK